MRLQVLFSRTGYLVGMTQIQSIGLFGVAAVLRAAPNERILVAAETATLDSGIRRRLTLAQRQTLTEIV